MGVYYIDGDFVASGEASVPVNDLALLRGYGVFDFLRTYGGKPFLLDEHLCRLIKSAALVGLDFPWNEEEIREVVIQALALNGYPESNIRIIVTGGPSPDFLLPAGRPRLLVLIDPPAEFPPEWYSQGVKVTTTPVTRSIPGAKSLNYLSGITALLEGRKLGAVEAISVDRTGRVLEGQTVSLFAFFGDKMVTNEDGVLPGITRRLILDLTEEDFAREIRDMRLVEILRADELLLTASNKEVVPVVQVDDAVIGNGVPGPNTRKVMKIFRDYTAAFAEGREGNKY